MPAKHIKVCISLPATLHEKIADYRHEARHETRAAAMTALIVAGLQSVAKPAESSKPAERKLVAYAGKDRTEHRPAEWVARP